MGLYSDIQKRIKAKQAEIERIDDRIRELRLELRSAEAYIQGLNDILPKVAREEGIATDDAKAFEIRLGSAADRVRQLLLEIGQPLHITEILAGLNREPTNANKVSLGGTLARYVREGVIFSRPAPNTFGLLDTSKAKGSQAHTAGGGDDELPEGFGK